MLDGEYGVQQLFIGVPVVLGAEGVEKIIQLQLTTDEKSAFDASTAEVKKLIDELKQKGYV
jgi:malate dehydrogenase